MSKRQSVTFSPTKQIHVKQTETKPTFKERLIKLKNSITVEPFLLCYILPNVISAVTVQKLNLEKSCRANLHYNDTICGMIINGMIENITDISAQTQVLVADMTVWSSPLQSFLPALMMLPLGAWSDRTSNRKVLMLLPLIGEIVSAIGMLLTTYYFMEWPLFVTGLIESVPTALTGGFSLIILSVYSYMSDITTVDERTFRIGVVTIIVTLSIPIGSAISGILTETLGYYGIFVITLMFYVVGFIYVYFCIHDVKREPPDYGGNNCLSILNPKYVLDTLLIPFKFRPNGMRLRILLVILVHIIITGPVHGEGAVFFLYVLQNFMFSIIDYSLFTTYITLIGLIGTSIAITLFSKLLKMDDTLLGIIATICKVCSSVLYSLAPNWKWLYAAPVIDIFGNSGVTAIRSLGTKLVQPNEVGKMSSIIGLVDALVPTIYKPAYSKVYSSTVNTFPGAFYLLGGMMTLPALFIFIYLYIQHKRDHNRPQTQINEKNGIQNKSFEIEVTHF